jgi:hypothetical protein
MNHLIYIRDIPWSEIFNTWKSVEEDSWREYYEQKGFESWEDWRRKYVDVIKPQERVWKLYKIVDPQNYIAKCFVGPFKGWTKYYKDRDHSRFQDIAQHPDIRDNEKVARLTNRYPKEVFFIGLSSADRTMLIEGTHRATSLVLRAHDGDDTITNARIALTTFSKSEEDAFQNIFQSIQPTHTNI